MLVFLFSALLAFGQGPGIRIPQYNPNLSSCGADAPLALHKKSAPEGFILSSSLTVSVGETLVMEASVAEPEEAVSLHYAWDLGDGRTETGQSIAFSYPRPGAYQVALTASDQTGLDETPFRRWVLVNDPALDENNQAPIARITEPAYNSVWPVNTPISFRARVTDLEDDPPAIYYWDFDDGTLLAASAEASETLHVYPSTDEYARFFLPTLAVRDSRGHFSWNSGITGIGIYEGAVPPDGRIISPNLSSNDDLSRQDLLLQLRPGEQLELEGEVIGLGQPQDYLVQWLLFKVEDYELQGEPLFFSSDYRAGTLSYDHFSEPGDYLVMFYVSDPEGHYDPVPDLFLFRVQASAFSSEEVQIVEPGFDHPLCENEEISLSALFNDFYGYEETQLSFYWKIQSVDSGEVLAQYEGPRVDFVSFPGPGLYRIDLEFGDSFGNRIRARESRYLVVYPELGHLDGLTPPPDLTRLAPALQEHQAPRGLQMTFAARGIDPDGGAISAYHWDFGTGGPEGTSSLAEPGRVTFEEPGNYRVRVWAKDESGSWSLFPLEWRIYIYLNNIPPQGEITEPPLVQDEDFERQRLLRVPLGTEVRFRAQASDPDGNLLNGLWLVNFEFCETCAAEGFTFQASEPGLYPILFLAIDEGGELDPFPDFRILQVYDPNVAPEGYIFEPENDITVEPGEPLFFLGFPDDPNLLEATFSWEFAGARTDGADTSSQFVYPVVYETESPPDQPYLVRLTVGNGILTDPTPAEVRVHVKRYSDSDFEPNNRLDEAKPLRPGSYSGLELGIAGGDSRDFFVFEVTQEGKDVQIGLAVKETQNAQGSLQLQIHRRRGDTWEVLETSRLETRADTLTLQNMEAGTYALEIGNSEQKRDLGLSYGISLNTLQPQLLLPFLVEDGNLTSKMGVINPSGEAVSITVTGLDSNGEVVVGKSLELPAKGRLYQPSLDFFGKKDERDLAKSIQWVRISSQARLMGFTIAETQDKTQLLGVTALTAPASRLVVPHIATQTGMWYTRAVVVNAAAEARDLNFEGTTGAREIKASFKSNEQSDFRFTQLFGDSLPSWGSFHTKSGKEGLAGIEIFGRADGKRVMAGLEMINLNTRNPSFARNRKNLYFTHVAKDTANFWTGLALINLENQPSSYSLVGYDDAGQELVRQDNLTMPAGGKLLNTVGQIFPAKSAGISWIEVQTDSELGGFELFGDHASQRMAGIQAESELADTLVFPHIDQREGAYWTGINILNLAAESLDVRLKAYADSGELLAETTIVLAARTKFVRTANLLFPGGLPQGATHLEATANRQALLGFVLFGTLNADGSLGEQMDGLRAIRK